MLTKPTILCLLICLSGAAFGQSRPKDNAAPLSAIEWLDEVPPQIVLPKAPTSKPPKAKVKKKRISPPAAVSKVEVKPLDQPAARQIGLVPPRISGMPLDLWEGSKERDLARILERFPHLDLPAAQAVLFALLLTEANTSWGEGAVQEPLELARIDALIKTGALEPALAILLQIGPSENAEVAHRFIETALLNETEAAACQLIGADPKLAPSYAHRIFCTARDGDWETANLLLGTARVLDVLSPLQIAALERFLDPDLFEDEPELERPKQPDALMFRIYEALGEPIATRRWPVVYANADLRDVHGWKTQLEAAERLAKTGALPANQLLGIYSLRQPAASGGIWDRVTAVQQFETALKTKSPVAVAKTIGQAWDAMRKAGLAVPFAKIFTPQLLEMDLPEGVRKVAIAMALSSEFYETVPEKIPDATALEPFGIGVATGQVASQHASNITERAIARGFSGDVSNQKLLNIAKEGRLGEAILQTLKALHEGSQGNMDALSTALGTMRALGLEDAARRAALQILFAPRPK